MTERIIEFDRSLEDGRWHRFYVRHAGEDLPFDIKVRPQLRGEARRLVRQHQRERREGGTIIREIPPEKERAFGMAAADYQIADWGGSPTSPPDRPHGPKARFQKGSGLLVSYLPEAESVGIQMAPDDIEPSDVEVRTWPLTKGFKYLLLQVIPGLDEQIAAYARELTMAVTEMEEDEEGNS